MFERFTDRAIHVIMVAASEARKSGHNLCGTEHILLGLAKEHSGLTKYLLDSAGFDLERCEHELERAFGRGADFPVVYGPFAPVFWFLNRLRPMPLSTNTLRLIKEAIREADSLGVENILPEHILMALVSKLHDSRGATILVRMGVPLHGLQNKIMTATAR